MTLYLRNNNNRTIVDVEINNSKNGIDVSCVVNIQTYSELLLVNLDKQDDVIESFYELSEIRGWFFEVYLELTDEPSFQDAVNQIKNKLLIVAGKFKLNFVTD